MQSPEPTRIHQRLINVLSELGYSVGIEVDFIPYRVDCYLREFHCAFEADGRLYHNPRKDRKRDSELMVRYSLPVCHFTEDELLRKGNEEELKDKIQSFLKEHCYDL